MRGKWLNGLCQRLQNIARTVTGAARKHGKTTVVLGFVCWLLFRCDLEPGRVKEYLYIMYSADLAAEKIQKCKEYIKVNPYFRNIKDLKPTADTILEYRVGKYKFRLKPAGVFSFKRGKHPNGVICDDILRDPQKRMDVEQIRKVTETFEREITSLPKEGGFLHLIGTSQDKSDIFFKLKALPGWDFSWNPAFIDRKKNIVLWEEMFSAVRLRDIELNETGKKGFQTEYQLNPVRSIDGYFTDDEIEEQTDSELINYGIFEKEKEEGIEFEETFAGYDIGKKRHPSHIAVYQAVKDKIVIKGKEEEEEITYLIEICSLWLDHKDYSDQLEVCQQLIRRFGIVKMYYDNTKGELEGFEERGELPEEMTPFIFSAKSKQKSAVDFEKFINKKRIFFLKDSRQKSQITSVDNNLDAPETKEGHGDSFWSNALAVQAYLEGSIDMLSTE